MASKGRNLLSLRNSNKNLILWKLFDEGSSSRLALSKSIGLTTAGVSKIVSNLIEDKLVIEKGNIKSNTSGRPELIIDINYEKLIALGICIQAKYVKFSVCTLKEILETEDFSISEMGEGKIFIEKIAKLINEYKEKYKSLLGVGITIYGKVDEKKGIAKDSYGLFENNFHLAQEISQRTNIDVYLGHNIRSVASMLISSKNKNFLYLRHGKGLGGAIADSSRIITGAKNNACEIGHIIAEADGKLCRCGKRGCIETIVGSSAIENAYYEMSGKKKNINELYNDMDKEVVEKIFMPVVGSLAMNIANAITLINPYYIIVSGGIFDNDFYYKNIIKEIEKIMNKKDSFKFKRLDNLEETERLASCRLVFNKILFNK